MHAFVLYALLLTASPSAPDPVPPVPGGVPELVVLSADSAAQLTPAFTITPAGVKKAQERGRSTAQRRRDWKGLCKPNAYAPRRAHTRRAYRDSMVWCLSLGGTPIALAAYDGVRRNAPAAVPAELALRGAELSELSFVVKLASVPYVEQPMYGETDKWPRVIAANYGDTDATRFVLADDCGNEQEIFDGGWRSDSEMRLAIYGRPEVIDPAPSGPIGPSGAREVHSSNAAYTEPSYCVTYRLSFPVRREDGKPVYSPKARRLTLRIFTTTGEKTVDFRLPAGPISR